MPLGEDGGKIASTNGERKIHLKRSKKNIFFRLVDFELSARDEKKKENYFHFVRPTMQADEKNKVKRTIFSACFLYLFPAWLFYTQFVVVRPFFFVAKLVFYLI